MMDCGYIRLPAFGSCRVARQSAPHNPMGTLTLNGKERAQALNCCMYDHRPMKQLFIFLRMQILIQLKVTCAVVIPSLRTCQAFKL